MESFFSTLKLERANRRRYQTRDEARADLFATLNGFTIPDASIQPWAISARLNSSGSLQPKENVRRNG
jgi:hypothetical protein